VCECVCVCVCVCVCLCVPVCVLAHLGVDVIIISLFAISKQQLVWLNSGSRKIWWM